MEGAVNRPAALTGCTGGFHRASIAGSGIGPIDRQLLSVLRRPAWEPLSCGASVLVPLAIIRELRRAIEGRAVPVGQRDVGPDAGVLDGLNILEGAVRRIADGPLG